MTDNRFSDAEINLEFVAQNAAHELLNAIVWASGSEAEVPATIERLFALIYNEWQQMDWSQYSTSFGIDPLDDAVNYSVMLDEEDDEAALPS